MLTDLGSLRPISGRGIAISNEAKLCSILKRLFGPCVAAVTKSKVSLGAECAWLIGDCDGWGSECRKNGSHEGGHCVSCHRQIE
jgi:hypothetical protein